MVHEVWYDPRTNFQFFPSSSPFHLQYEWLDEMFREMATFVFFVMTGYKFRPASNNPYFAVSQDDDDFEMGQVLIGGTAINDQE